LERRPFGDWLATLTAARRECHDDNALLDASRAGILEGVRTGVTTFADTATSTAPLRAMRELGVRGVGYLEVFGPAPDDAAAVADALFVRASAERLHDTPLVRTGVSPHAPYTVSEPLLAAVATRARAERWPIAMHIAEGTAEVEFVTHGRGPFADGLRARGIAVMPSQLSPVAWMERAGALAAHTLLIHAIALDDLDRARIADSGAAVVHCPVSNLKLGHGIARVVELQRTGTAVGLGSDSVASNDRMHLLEEARLAALLQAHITGTPDVLSARDVLRMATADGARALGLESSVGTIAVGRRADLCAFALDLPDVGPVFDPETTLIHILGGRARACFTMVDGRVLVRDGALVTPIAELASHLETFASRLIAWRDHRELLQMARVAGHNPR
jgi:5-methylthioadenosine/S-adenosylhomocysteine deaminase